MMLGLNTKSGVFIDIESDVGVEYDVVEYLQIFESGVGVEYNVFVDI